MDHEVRTGTFSFVAVILAAFLTFGFRSQLWALLGLAWVAPLIVAPFLAPPCKHDGRLLLSRTRVYALIGALAGYASWFPLALILNPLLLGAGIWVAIAISAVVAAGLSAWFAVSGCRHYARLAPS